MPELPEVHTVVLGLRPKLIGKTVRAVRLHRPDILTPPAVDLPAELLGRTIRAVDRRGKRIVFTLDTGSRFYVHLGMTGQLTVVPPAPAPAPPPTHTHLEIDFAPMTAARPTDRLRFRDPRRFGGVWWLGSD